MLKKKIKLTNSEKKLLEPESWLISITSLCLITHAGKCNLFVINTQCQIKNKQLLCFSQYLQHRFNYFDPIQGGNEELVASDVGKPWQFLHCVLGAASASAPVIYTASVTVTPLPGNAARWHTGAGQQDTVRPSYWVPHSGLGSNIPKKETHTLTSEGLGTHECPALLVWCCWVWGCMYFLSIRPKLQVMFQTEKRLIFYSFTKRENI